MQNLQDSQLCVESKAEPSVAKGGTPHRKNVYLIKYDHLFILGWGHRTQFQTLAVGRVGGRDMIRIVMPLRGSISQDKTYKILSLAENPRWSQSVAIIENKVQ